MKNKEELTAEELAEKLGQQTAKQLLLKARHQAATKVERSHLPLQTSIFKTIAP